MTVSPHGGLRFSRPPMASRGKATWVAWARRGIVGQNRHQDLCIADLQDLSGKPLFFARSAGAQGQRQEQAGQGGGEAKGRGISSYSLLSMGCSDGRRGTLQAAAQGMPLYDI